MTLAPRPATTVVDLHADLLWRTEVSGKDPWTECEGESMDLPRMLRHGPDLQCLTLYTPADRTGEAATDYADTLHGIWRALVERGDGRLGWVRSRADLHAVSPASLHGMLTMEGASPLRGEIALLDHYFALGVRSLGLTHNPRNAAGAGCTVPAHEPRGLTPFGRELVRRCAALGVLLDVAHLAPEGIDDLLDAAEATSEAPPVVSTHTGVLALTPHPRNLSDDHLRRIAATGGLVGITLYPPHVRWEGRPDSLSNALDHVEHVAALTGIRHVAVGADLDGFTPPGFPGGGDDARCYGLLDRGLAERGFDEPARAAVLGGNALRVLRSTLPPS